METKGLIIRSRLRWAEEGEKSSKYFCNLEKRTGEKKSIFKLKNEDDDIIVDQHAILEEINSFYQTLYTKHCGDNSSDNEMEDFLDSIEFPQLNEVDKVLLDKPISKKELFDTIASMKHNKSPGLDGLPV